MPRVKRSNVRRKHRAKVLSLAKGYYGSKSRLFRIAKVQVEKSLLYAYRDRRVRKRDFRSLWIIRINAAAREHGLSYSRFMQGLGQAGLDLNRKTLAEIAARDREAFARIAAQVKQALAGQAA